MSHRPVAVFILVLYCQILTADISHHLLVWRDSPNSVPGNIISFYGPLILVDIGRPVTQQDIQNFTKLHHVRAAQRDYFVHFGDHLAAIPSRARGGSNKEKCHVTERCLNGKAKYWAQEVLAADLLREQMALWNVTNTASVSVVDSGFDATRKGDFQTHGEIITDVGATKGDEHPIRKSSWSKFSGELGDPNLDESGHGTMVSSVISGKDGIGVADNVKLAVYRVTEKGNKGSTRSSTLQMAMWKACQKNRDPDGITIINMSWGGRLDEANVEPDEDDEVSRLLIEKLAENGCLIFKASGNSNFRNKRVDDLDDAYLRVAAVDSSRELSGFSTVGEIQAPGSEILMVRSSQAKRKVRVTSLCSMVGKRLASGTSFAAPLAAGIAAQTVRVLKHFGKLKMLGPKDRIRLLNRILRASTFYGSINGLRAAKIAQHWSELPLKEQGKALADEKGVESLRLLLDDLSDPLCQEPLGNCKRARQCIDIKACLKRSRHWLTLCKVQAPKEVMEIAKTAMDNDAFELGNFFTSIAKSNRLDPKDHYSLIRHTADRYLRSQNYQLSFAGHVDTEKQVQGLRTLNPNFIRMVLVPYFEERAKRKTYSSSRSLERLLRGILLSRDLMKSIAMGEDPVTGEHRGSTPNLDSIHRILKSAKTILGERRYVMLLDTYLTGIFEDLKRGSSYESWVFPMETSTAPARILDRLIGDESDNPRLHGKLLELEKKLLENMQQYNQFYGENTEPLVWILMETYPTRSSMVPIIERHITQIEEAFRQNDLTKLAPIQIIYAMEGPDRFGPNGEAILQTLEHLASNKGWGRTNDKEILELALAQIVKHWKQYPIELQTKLKERFQQLVINATNVEFVGHILRGFQNDLSFGESRILVLLKITDDKQLREDGYTYMKHPFLSREVLGVLGRKATAYFKAASPENIDDMSGRSESVRGLAHAWYTLTYPLPAGVNEITAPFSAKQPISRLNQDLPKPKTYPVSELGFPEFVTSLLTLSSDKKFNRVVLRIVDDGFDVSSYDHKTHPDLTQTLESIPQHGKWREQIDRFGNSYAYGYGHHSYARSKAVRSLRKFLNHLDHAHRQKEKRIKEAQEQARKVAAFYSGVSNTFKSLIQTGISIGKEFIKGDRAKQEVQR